jgi:hypothetical protein
VPEQFRNLCDHPINRRYLMQAAALGLVGTYTTRGRSQTSAGAVLEVKGEAFVDARGQHRVIGRESPLFVNDRVGTGSDSRLVARLGRDTTLRLGERASLLIERFLIDAGGEINLQSGALLFERPPGSPPARVQIRSPYGLIAVRGTRFFAGPSNGVFGIFVEYGLVLVIAGGRRVALRARQGTNITQPGSRPTKPAPWNEVRVSAALASVQ